jgi:ferritin
MKIIEILSKHIEEEIKDSACYAKMAIEYRETYPDLAETLYKISLEETEHMNKLHAEVVKLIEQYKAEKGEPPAAMLAVYNYLHKQHIENAVEAKALQTMYKESK